MNFEALIGNNVFFIYLFAVISVIAFETFSAKQKISIIYIFTYGISFNGQLDKKILLVCMIFTLFIYEEYLTTSETKKKEFFYRIIYKGMDFMYLYVFRYKMLIVCVAIGLRSYTFNCIMLYALPECLHSYIEDYGFSGITVLSAVLLCLGIHLMHTDFVQMHTFERVFKIFEQYPYYVSPLSEPQKREQLCRRMELIADIEDRTFFMRSKSYHFWSCENVKVLWKTKRSNIAVSQNSNNSSRIKCVFANMMRSIHKLCHILPDYFNQVYKDACRIPSCLKCFVKNTHGILKKIKSTLKAMIGNAIYVINYIYFRGKIIGKKIFKYLIRGHSTIEMQMVRILFYKRGLLLGNPIVRNKNNKIRIGSTIRKIYCIIERKIFEVIYSSIVFASLKHYLGINQITSSDYLRYYIVYLYLHVVQTNLNGKKYCPVSNYFEEVDASEWSMEKIFVAGLGLCSRTITPKRIQIYDFIVKKYDLNITEIYRLCNLGRYE